MSKYFFTRLAVDSSQVLNLLKNTIFVFLLRNFQIFQTVIILTKLIFIINPLFRKLFPVFYIPVYHQRCLLINKKNP